MILPNEKYIYQFGDPKSYNLIQGADTFIFPTENLSANLTTNVKTEFSENPFSDGDINNLQNRVAFLEALNINPSFILPKDFDFNYLKKIFLGRTKKVYFIEYDKDGVANKIYANYATCTGGLEGGYQTDVEFISKTVDLKFVYSKFFDITEEVDVLDYKALNLIGISNWQSVIAGSGWGQASGFGWGQAVANYSIKFKDLSIEQKKEFFDFNNLSYTNSKGNSQFYNLTWNDTWTPNYNLINFDTSLKTASLTLTNNNLTDLNLNNLDLNSTAVNNLFKVRINQTGGLTINNSVTISNPINNSGFTFTWLSPGNSPANILVNTFLAPNKVFNLDTGLLIDQQNYSLTYSSKESSRLLEVDGSYQATTYPNINVSKEPQALKVQKNSSSNLTISIQNLNQLIF